MEKLSPLTTAKAQLVGSSIAIAAVLTLGLLLAAALGTRLEKAALHAEEMAARAWIVAVLPEEIVQSAADDLVQDVDEVYFGTQEPVDLYTAASSIGGSARAIKFIAIDGYHGDITLAMGVDGSGQITRLRVLSHAETPGFGGFIANGDDPWMRAFAGRSLRSLEPAKWRLREDGGAIDGVSGATITANAVVAGVARALGYLERDTTEERWSN